MACPGMTQRTGQNCWACCCPVILHPTSPRLQWQQRHCTAQATCSAPNSAAICFLKKNLFPKKASNTRTPSSTLPPPLQRWMMTGSNGSSKLHRWTRSDSGLHLVAALAHTMACWLSQKGSAAKTRPGVTAHGVHPTMHHHLKQPWQGLQKKGGWV